MYDVGTVISFLILVFSAFFSFVIATFINEIQGSGNAIKKLGLNQDQVKPYFGPHSFFHKIVHLIV